MNRFEERLFTGEKEGLFSEGIRVLQVNVGLWCNQACSHCHLGASPDRDEIMEWSTMDKLLDIAVTVRPELVDITGGAPEKNPRFTHFIAALTDRDLEIQLRTNLTALVAPGSEGLMVFLKEKGVRLTASLPCYLEEKVKAQRGEGVFEKSIEALCRLNELGYGVEGGLTLNLVYNPGGAFLPGDQASLEEDYRRELGGRFGLKFTNLFTIANMPIGRFREILDRKERYERYMALLEDSFNSDTVPGLMCRSQVSVGWDGRLYDCDFNLALGLTVNYGAPGHIDQWDLKPLRERRVVTGPHCFGCTAGCGSSCGGALVENG
jgi:radical SAM/Cys-rich protein